MNDPFNAFPSSCRMLALLACASQLIDLLYESFNQRHVCLVTWKIRSFLEPQPSPKHSFLSSFVTANLLLIGTLIG